MRVCVRICKERKEDRSREKPVVEKAKSARRKSYVRVSTTQNGLSKKNILIILQMHMNIERKELR